MNMKRFAFALLAALLLCLLAGSALAAPTTLYVGVEEVDVANGESGDGWSYADGVLTLNNAHISQSHIYGYWRDAAAGIYFAGGDLTIELIGDNSIQIMPESNNSSACGIVSDGTTADLNITGNGSLTIGFASDSSGNLQGFQTLNLSDITIGTGSDAPKVYITTNKAKRESYGLNAGGFNLMSGLLSISAGSSENGLSYGIHAPYGVPVLSNGTLIIQGNNKALEYSLSYDGADRFTINHSAAEWYWRTDANAAWNEKTSDNIINLEESKPTHFEWTSALFDVTAVAGEGGSVSGGGSYAMYTNPSVTLTATPDAGYKFVKWQNAAGETISTEAVYTFIATEDVELTAVFELLPVVSDIPQTGDNSNVILWFALACISLFGMMTLVRKRKEA